MTSFDEISLLYFLEIKSNGLLFILIQRLDKCKWILSLTAIIIAVSKYYNQY